MIDISSVLGFAVASFAVAVSPGPSWVYVISSTLAQDRQAGLIATLGNATGILCHVVAAILGMSALLHYSAWAFNAFKWVGALYLVYLGFVTIANKTQLDLSVQQPKRRFLQIFRDGVFVNVLNPKASLLILALLPQFINPAAGNPLEQTVFLGCLHVFIASFVLTNIVYFAHKASTTFKKSPRIQSVFRWFVGTLFFGFGIRLALAER